MKPPKAEPCKQCPFLRTCAGGWLGDSTPEEFIRAAHSEEMMPCHTEVDYEDPKWRSKLKGVHQCSGRSIYLKHICKIPRDRSIPALPADKELVFSGPGEFLKHHGRGLVQTPVLVFECGKPEKSPRVGGSARRVIRTLRRKAEKEQELRDEAEAEARASNPYLEDSLTVICPDCGEEQEDMGVGTSCGSCGFAPMPRYDYNRKEWID